MKIEDLPSYIRKHSKQQKDGIKIIFPQGYQIENIDAKELPKAKKWIKLHGGGYDDRGFWFIPNENFHDLSEFERVIIGGKFQYILKEKI